MSRLKVGRVRVRLAAMLAEHGIIIEPRFLDTQDGPVYRNPGNGLARWFGYARWRSDLQPDRGIGCHLSSWDKMSDCVRFGFDISPDKGDGWRHVTVVAREVI